MTIINKINSDKGFDEYLDHIKNNDENVKKIRIIGKKLYFNYGDLEYVSKMNKGIDEGALQKLAEALYNNTHVKKLCLRVQSFGSKEAKILAELISKNSSIQDFDLGFNQIGDEGAQFLAEGIKNNYTIKVMDLGYNKIGNAGIEVLAKALKVNSSINKIVLDYNNINSKATEHLVTCLKYNNHSIINIDVWPSLNLVSKVEGKALLTHHHILQALAKTNEVFQPLWQLWEMNSSEYTSYLQWLPSEMVDDMKIKSMLN